MWIPGTVSKLVGSVTYHVKLHDGKEIRRHADQLRARLGDAMPEESTEPQEEDVDFPVAGSHSPGDELGEEASTAASAQNQPVVPDATNPAGVTAAVPPDTITPPEPQRRSARQHVPPDRYGSPVVYWSPVAYWQNYCH